MRILGIKRQVLGGLHSAAHQLALGAQEIGVQFELVDVSDFVPNETGGEIDKAVSSKIAELAEDYDLVHAFGYRLAWACSEAFGDSEAWVYSAQETPNSTHPRLIQRLNNAQAGFCATNHIRIQLDDALAMNLLKITPGYSPDISALVGQERARASLKLAPDAKVILVAARWIENGGVLEFVNSFLDWSQQLPEAILLLVGDGPLAPALEQLITAHDRSSSVRLLRSMDDVSICFEAANIHVTLPGKSGFSMGAVEALAHACPVLLPDRGGFGELIERDLSGFVYDPESELMSTLDELLAMPITLEAAGRAGRVRSIEKFSRELYAERVVEQYRSIL